jgi:hypothetical protein
MFRRFYYQQYDKVLDNNQCFQEVILCGGYPICFILILGKIWVHCGKI